MIDPAVLDAMLAAGCTADQIVAAVKADAQAEREREEARREAKRAGNAERQRRHRERNALSRVTGVTNSDTPSPEGSLSPEPPILPNPQPIPPSPPKGGSSPTDRAFEAFCAAVQGTPIPAPRKLTADRRRKIEARLAEHGEDGWLEACRKLAASPFCRGENDRGWRADLDFLCQPKSFNGLIEGKYDFRPRQNGHSPPPGRRMNAVEALISRRMEQAHGSESRGGDSSDAELLPPDKPELRALVGELGQALRWPVGPGDH